MKLNWSFIKNRWIAIKGLFTCKEFIVVFKEKKDDKVFLVKYCDEGLFHTFCPNVVFIDSKTMAIIEDEKDILDSLN